MLKKKVSTMDLLESKKNRFILLLCICVAVSFSFGSRYMRDDNFAYAVQEINTFNNEIFSDNVTNVGINYSPRRFANNMMAVMMRCKNGSWLEAALLFIRINYVLYAFAAALFASWLFDKNLFLGGFLIAICCCTNRLVSLGFGMIGAYDVFLGTAIPLSLIAISFVFFNKKNWDLAWFFLACSELMHVHEGIWAGAIVGIIWCAECFSSKKITWAHLRLFPGYVLSVLLVVLPSLINSGVSIDNSLFVNIYARIRAPHHLLVSSWGKKTILLSFLMILFALYLLRARYRKNPDEREMFISFLFLTVFWIALLMVQYIFTEVFPSSTITTLYIPKCFKYITLLAALIYIKCGIEEIESKHYLQGIALLGIVLMPAFDSSKYRIIFILFLGLYYISNRLGVELISRKEDEQKMINLIWFFLLLSCLFVYYSVAEHPLLGLPLLLTIFYLSFIYKIIKIRVLANCIVALGVGLCLFFTSTFFFFDYTKKGYLYIDGEKYIRNCIGDDAYQLSIDFGNRTGTQERFIADPYNTIANGIQLVSQRSCFVLYKNIPSEKDAVFEWWDRTLYAKKLIDGSLGEIVAGMKEKNIKYILVFNNRYSEFEASELFEPFLITPTVGFFVIKECI